MAAGAAAAHQQYRPDDDQAGVHDNAEGGWFDGGNDDSDDDGFGGARGVGPDTEQLQQDEQARHDVYGNTVRDQEEVSTSKSWLVRQVEMRTVSIWLCVRFNVMCGASLLLLQASRQPFASKLHGC